MGSLQTRKTEVHFSCSLDGSTSVSQVKESAVCEYSMVLATPLLCRHPAFRPQQDLCKAGAVSLSGDCGQWLASTAGRQTPLELHDPTSL